MAAIARREELDVGARDRPDQLGHALGAGRRTAGIDRRRPTFACVSSAGGKDGAQRRVLSRQAVIRRDDAMERAQRVRRLDHVRLGERRVTNQLRRAVRRAAVGIDHHRAQAGKVAREAHVHRADDVDDRRGVVQRRQADQDVHLADGDQLPEQRVGKRLCSPRVLGRDRRLVGLTLQPAQPEPVEVVRPHHHDVRLAVRCAERCCRRTSRSGWRRRAGTDRAPPPARFRRGC